MKDSQALSACAHGRGRSQGVRPHPGTGRPLREDDDPVPREDVCDVAGHDARGRLGEDPGLIKDGVEAHLQELLAEHIGTLGDGYSLIRREYMTAIGPVDILGRDADGVTVAVEIKRRGEIDGVEQLTRYLELLNRDPLLAPVTGIFAAQVIKPQARTLATDRGIRCVTLDYDTLRGIESTDLRLF